MMHVPSYPKKSLGQHWLRDADSLRAMRDAAEVSADDTVLEIGPGLGTLTELLVRQAKKVVAVEFDKTLAAQLPDCLKNILGNDLPVSKTRSWKQGSDGLFDRLTVVQEDILKFNLSTLPAGYKVVANIPYYLTSNLIRVLSESSNPPAKVALLVQKEVAERAAAGPGGMSLLSVMTQFYWQVRLGRVVRAELFEPPPKVDSQILILDRHPQPLFADITPKLFFHAARAGFAQRRKTLLNSLGSGLHFEREATAALLARAGISATTRAQALSLDDWHRLARLASENSADVVS